MSDESSPAGPLVPEVHPDIRLGSVHYYADGTSDPGESKDRWTEVTVYKLSQGAAYAVYGAGRTAIEGEQDRYWLFFCPTATDLLRALLRPVRNGGKHLPSYADEALRAAAEIDSAVRSALAEWDAAARWAR